MRIRDRELIIYWHHQLNANQRNRSNGMSHQAQPNSSRRRRAHRTLESGPPSLSWLRQVTGSWEISLLGTVRRRCWSLGPKTRKKTMRMRACSWKVKKWTVQRQAKLWRYNNSHFWAQSLPLMYQSWGSRRSKLTRKRLRRIIIEGAISCSKVRSSNKMLIIIASIRKILKISCKLPTIKFPSRSSKCSAQTWRTGMIVRGPSHYQIRGGGRRRCLRRRLQPHKLIVEEGAHLSTTKVILLIR